MTDLAKRLSFLQDDKLFSFKNNLSKYPVSEIFEDENQNFWFLHPQTASVIVESDSSSQNVNHHHYEDTTLKGLKIIYSVDKDHCIIINSRGVNHFKNYEHSFSEFKGKKTVLRGFPMFSVQYKDSILLTSGNRIFTLSLEDHSLKSSFFHINHLLDLGVNNLFVDADDDLWIATRNGVIYFQDQPDGSTKMIHLLKGNVTQTVFQDAEKNYWITTQREGVFKLSSTDITIYKKEEFGDKVAAVNSFSDDRIIVGYNNNWVSILNEDLKPVFEKKISVANSEIYDIVVDQAGKEGYII